MWHLVALRIHVTALVCYVALSIRWHAICKFALTKSQKLIGTKSVPPNMSLLKIPLLLSSAIAVQVAITPPHTTSTEELYYRSRRTLIAHKMTYPSHVLAVRPDSAYF
jgi:type III secretory pathway component EscR